MILALVELEALNWKIAIKLECITDLKKLPKHCSCYLNRVLLIWHLSYGLGLKGTCGYFQSSIFHYVETIWNCISGQYSIFGHQWFGIFVFFSFKFVYKPYSGLIPTCNKCFNQSLTWSRKREKPKKPRETPNLCPQPLSLYRSELFPSRPLVILLLYDLATWPTDHSKNEIKWTSEIYSRKHRWSESLLESEPNERQHYC